MTAAVDALISHWRKFDPNSAPYIHPDDEGVLLKVRGAKFVMEAPATPRGWVDAVYDDRDSAVQLGLLPVPFMGNLREADIFIALLNPGLAPADFEAELNHPDYRDQLVKSLKQDGCTYDDYPFWSLDPRFCWTGAALWWRGKLGGIISTAAERWSCGYSEAAHRVSHRIAVVELFPYHSRDFRLGRALSSLKSCEVARNFIKAMAKDDTKTVIVTRQTKEWGVEGDGVRRVVYAGGHSRGAAIGPETWGGRAILNQLFDIHNH